MDKLSVIFLGIIVFEIIFFVFLLLNDNPKSSNFNKEQKSKV